MKQGSSFSKNRKNAEKTVDNVFASKYTILVCPTGCTWHANTLFFVCRK